MTIQKLSTQTLYCWFFALISLSLLTQCQSTEYQPRLLNQDTLLVSAETFKNANSSVNHPIEKADDIFQLPEEAKEQIHKLIVSYRTMPEQTRAVLKFIASYADTGLIYDNSATYTASETLRYTRANCLSLSILAYSLAKEVGIDANFQDVQIPEYWTSQLNQTWLNAHVNLRIKQRRQVDNGMGVVMLGSDFIIDFDPYSLKKRFKTQPITEQRIVAMFYNNKAAFAFAEQNYAQAYAYYKAAIKTDPKFAVTWSNLGILYRIHNLNDLAENLYYHSLALEPDSINTLSNLAYLYRLQNKLNLADSLERKVTKQRETNPYYYLMLGNEAYIDQQYRLSIQHYKKSLSLDRQNHEAYFGLAKSYFILEQLPQAERYLTKAKQHALTKQDEKKYQNKLNLLNQIALAY